MTRAGCAVLAVVPARGGSKGIPRKNLARVGGRSLVAHAAATIAQLDWVDVAVLSTDDEEIAAEGRRHGLDVPFMRPEALAADDTEAAPMWRHAWLEAETHAGRAFDVSVLIQPTSPLRTPEDVTRCVDAVVEGGHAAAATVSRTPAHCTPHKTVVLDGAGRIVPLLGPGQGVSTRQHVPRQYTRDGLCYAVRRDTLVDRLRITEEDCAGVVVDRPTANIDEPFDLEYAEWLLDRQRRLADGSDHG